MIYIVIICFIILTIFLGMWFCVKYCSVEVDSKIPIFKSDCDYDEYWGINHTVKDIMVKNKVLVIVDFQKDFYDAKEGTLYVPGAEKCVVPICDKILSGKYNQVILTLDWHEFKDESFSANGGQWPNHCIQHSAGAAIHPDILNAIQTSGIECHTFIKGNCYNHEEYGAFENIDIHYGNSTLLKNNLGDSVVFLSSNPENLEFTICGLAGDYCCFETYKNLIKKFDKERVIPYYEGMAFIGDKFDYSEKC